MTLELTMEELNRAPQISFPNSMLTVAPGSIFPPFMTVSFIVNLTSSSSLPSATPFFELQDIRAYIWKQMKRSHSSIKNGLVQLGIEIKFAYSFLHDQTRQRFK